MYVYIYIHTRMLILILFIFQNIFRYMCTEPQKMCCFKQHFLLVKNLKFYIKFCFHFVLYNMLIPYSACLYSYNRPIIS